MSDAVVHSDRFVTVMYCDDIRIEAGNKRAYMGVYSSDLQVQKLPTTLVRMCASITVSTPVTRPFEKIHLKVEHGEKALAELQVDASMIQVQMEQALKDPAVKRLNFQTEMYFSQLEITKESKLSVTVDTEAETIKGNALRLKVAEEGAPDYRFLCAELGIEVLRDASLLRLKMKTPEGRVIEADFHGEGIGILRDSITGAIRSVPGLIEWGTPNPPPQ